MGNFSIFEQIVALIPKNIFDSLSIQYKADRNAKGFTAWSHFLSMLCGQMCNCHSLRDVCFSMSLAFHNHKYLGISKPPTKSNLSYRNSHCDPVFFEALYHKFLGYFGQQLGFHGIPRLGGKKIYALDSTVIPLCLELFDWAKYRQQKGAIKLHTLLDFDGYMPSYVLMTDGKVADNTAARQLPVKPWSVVVADRGYMDFKLLDQWNQDDVYFVVRCKESQKWDIEMQRDTTGQANILSDCLIRPAKAESAVVYEGILRKITAIDPKTGKIIEVLTNNLFWTAETISLLYKMRWEIENFFKSIKQHLRIKSFLGTTPNAVFTQIWVSLIAMLLLKLLKTKAKYQWNMSNLVNAIRTTLFSKFNLFEWINNPIARQYEGNLKQTTQLSLFT